MGSLRQIKVAVLPNDVAWTMAWRLQLPLSAMDGPEFEITPLGGDDADLTPFDVIYVQRIWHEATLSRVRAAKAAGKKIVIDYDDQYPVTDPSAENFAAFGPGSALAAGTAAAMALADVIVTTTPQLAAHYRAMHGNVVVAPNAIDLGWDWYRRGPVPRPVDGLIVLWSGMGSHARGLHMLRPAVKAVLASRSDVTMVIAGPPEMAAVFDGIDRVFHLPPVPLERHFRAASFADVVVAPLVNNAYNGCKSEIKCIEAGAWGVPCLASDVAPYRRFAEAGEGVPAALLVPDDADMWREALIAVLANDQVRRSVGASARRVVETRYRLADANAVRAAMLRALVADGR